MSKGFKSTEFWATVAVDVAMLATALAGTLPAKWAAVAASIATIGYSISRGLAKEEIV
jgi:hypothetical protein